MGVHDSHECYDTCTAGDAGDCYCGIAACESLVAEDTTGELTLEGCVGSLNCTACYSCHESQPPSRAVPRPCCSPASAPLPPREPAPPADGCDVAD